MKKLLSSIGIALMIVALAVPGVVLASPAIATRDLPATVEPGAEFEVGITASDYGMMGQVVETLPAGFSYVSSSLDDSQVQVTETGVMFVLIGDASFTYSVTAATVEDTYTFSGIITDADQTDFAIAGETDITVSTVVGPVSFTTTLLEDWNLLSTPVLLDADNNALEQIFDAQSLANIEIYYSWDAMNEQWAQVLTDYEFLPLYAIYVKVSSGASATAEFIPSEEISGPPSRELQRGLNLIGPAPALEEGAFPDTPLNLALISIEEAEGDLRGYTMVISPTHNQTPWSYALGGEIQDLVPFNGYWVVMENGPDTLFGFSTTGTP